VIEDTPVTGDESTRPGFSPATVSAGCRDEQRSFIISYSRLKYAGFIESLNFYYLCAGKKQGKRIFESKSINYGCRRIYRTASDRGGAPAGI
jgi:hypothetical protein